MTIKEKAAAMKIDSTKMAVTSTDTRNNALALIAKKLIENQKEIFAANELDLKEAAENNIPDSVIKRLKFSESKLHDVTKGIENLIELKDMLFHKEFERELDEGLTLVKEKCPIGVIGVIFEARPDALVQIASLCIKSANCAILKGGSETKHTNKVLFNLIYNAAIESGLPENCLFQAELRNEISELLDCHEYVDLLIPRGSNSFVQYIMDNTKIPVMGHAEGMCHIYVDKDCDVDKAIPIIIDAKTQYTAACNAVETLLVHKDAVDKLMPKLNEAFRNNQIEHRATKDIADKYNCNLAVEEDFATEYLALIISSKTVDNIDEAIYHINKYGSHHTDCIITENSDAAEYFMRMVDSAGVYQNCSTRFADGFRYGFGAEVGISTGKIHARGPVGLDGLFTYKYKLYGNGHIVDDYATGKKEFHFRDKM
ncbi:MAG: glutamate-5-semialdehyde dehydrogenase [Lachnospiraceae bacterium]|nr:glutamate-5-semialdehyde dehydrogenase [Lachnospiraceae bacterium]MBQ2407657.1 glutamate-5-semialdehyde dehydrogenase [Lachnospiraceae bacterium]MEE0919350.1 glutamate-5-semialdehyde dehydrogenase [Lachnospiraceae bacterium]